MWRTAGVVPSRPLTLLRTTAIIEVLGIVEDEVAECG
jgi:hypothetical protein